MEKFFFILTLFISGLLGQDIILKDSYYLGSNLNKIIYFKVLPDGSEEYPEGNIYIYDLNNYSKTLLIKDENILNFTNVLWLDNQDIYISDGVAFYKYSIQDKKKNIIYKSNEHETINYFTVSKNENFIFINMKIYTEKNDYQKVLYINPKNEEREIIYEIMDNSIGEDVKNKLFYNESNNTLYILNINNELLALNLFNKKLKIIDNNVINFLFLNNNLFYIKNYKELIIYNISENNKFTLIKGNNLDLYFINNLNGKIVIGMHNKLYVYTENKNKFDIKLLEENDGNYVFVNGKVIVLQNDLGLYIDKDGITENLR